jgi:hypothetical protein
MAKYHVGQKINLWQHHIDTKTRTTRILKSVLVTVAEVKTGVKQDYTDEPSTDESVLAFAEDGTRYERFWDRVPISQTSDFYGQWSMRDDGELTPGYNPLFRLWKPMEAWCVYNDYLHYGVKKYNLVDKILGPDGQAIVPSGDVTKCEKHGTYQPKHIECFECVLENLSKKAS